GLAEQATMRGRGFLARWLYHMPASCVGRRQIAPPAVPGDVCRTYQDNMAEVRRIPGGVDEGGQPAAHGVRVSAGARQEMRAFERWLEPQLAEGEDLSLLAGWANKLAGAVARIAGILHVTEAVGSGRSWHCPILVGTVRAAVRLGRDYLLPHAQAAF